MFLRFINNSKLRLNSNEFKWFVFGNESSDLDSVVGSLVYSYYKQDMIGSDFAVIPVCCISKGNLKLKKDVNEWLSLFHINSDNDLIFLDDVIDLIDFEQMKNNVKISLIDHHRPQLPNMTNIIKEVIDHRQISYTYPEGQLELNHMKLAGSCCTLIASYIIETTSLDEREKLLEMLRGVILLDTDCLAKNNGKTTTEDVTVVETIEGVLGISSNTREGVYARLSQAKANISGFTVDMMVKRDLKILDLTWDNSNLKVAIPTLISVDVEDLLIINDLYMQLSDILKELNADVLIGITSGTLSHQRIGILIFSRVNNLNNKISEYLLMPENNLNVQSLVTGSEVKALYRGDLGITRKTLIPIIERFFESETEPQVSEQINNCSADICAGIHLSVKNADADIGIDIENDGAPYSLNTPLRSYSGSPDNRNSDVPLPSLNNRYTQLLVDRKRRIHRASVNDENSLDEDIKDIDKPVYDVSPRTFTPENTDDESVSDNNSDCKNEHRVSLPSLQHYFTTEKFKYQGEKGPEPDSTSESLITEGRNISAPGCGDTRINDLPNLETEDITGTEFNSLADKVHRKRLKLHSTHVDSIASALVDDILKESEYVIADEMSIESMLNEWSDSYKETEKKEIITSLKSNDLTKVAELLTSSLIRDCLKTHDALSMENEVNNSAKEVDVNEARAISISEQNGDIDDSASCSSLEGSLPNIDLNDNDVKLGNMVIEGNPNIVAGCMNSSCVDIVENSSFNLYRRISSNQLDFSEDEKELLNTAGDWLARKDDVIYSDTEQDENRDNGNSSSNGKNDETSKKIIFPGKEIYMDTSNLDLNTSTEISLNDLENMPTPDPGNIDESDVTEIIKTLSESSMPNEIPVQVSGDILEEVESKRSDESNFLGPDLEKYKAVINDAGYYFDATNNNERTQLITFSSCDFPDKSDTNYQLIMQFIFDHILSFLESMDTDFYTVVYFHCYGMRQKGPSLGWLHQSYQTVPYKLKKTLKHLYIVHPTIWVRAALFLSRFFINSKFYSKIRYVSELEELANHVPTSKIRFPSDVLK